MSDFLAVVAFVLAAMLGVAGVASLIAAIDTTEWTDLDDGCALRVDNINTWPFQSKTETTIYCPRKG